MHNRKVCITSLYLCAATYYPFNIQLNLAPEQSQAEIDLTAESIQTLIKDISRLSGAERVQPLLSLGASLRENGVSPEARTMVIEEMAALISSGEGPSTERLKLGELLGELGDPRILSPKDDGYYVSIADDGHQVQMARFPVTNSEFRWFVDNGGYDDESFWDSDSWAWRQRTKSTWSTKAAGENAQPFIVPNQPVVGVNWYEAQAFARAHNARLPTFDERLLTIRGQEKRPYPWGSPFGKGNANTREEVLGRPCAVGLFIGDRTPEGVFDLAGNVAEWCQDGVGDEKWIHPGCWGESFECSWAKARILEQPKYNSATWGFRLAR